MRTVWTNRLKESLGMSIFFTLDFIAIVIEMIFAVGWGKTGIAANVSLVLIGISLALVGIAAIGFWVLFVSELKQNLQKKKEYDYEQETHCTYA